jgi:hypothetical protein
VGVGESTNTALDKSFPSMEIVEIRNGPSPGANQDSVVLAAPGVKARDATSMKISEGPRRLSIVQPLRQKERERVPAVGVDRTHWLGGLISRKRLDIPLQADIIHPLARYR